MTQKRRAEIRELLAEWENEHYMDRDDHWISEVVPELLAENERLSGLLSNAEIELGYILTALQETPLRFSGLCKTVITFHAEARVLDKTYTLTVTADTAKPRDGLKVLSLTEKVSFDWESHKTLWDWVRITGPNGEEIYEWKSES